MLPRQILQCLSTFDETLVVVAAQLVIAGKQHGLPSATICNGIVTGRRQSRLQRVVYEAKRDIAMTSRVSQQIADRFLQIAIVTDEKKDRSRAHGTSQTREGLANIDRRG